MTYIPDNPKDKSLAGNIERLKWCLAIIEGEKHYRPDGSLITKDDAIFTLTAELFHHRKELIAIAWEYYNV